MGLKERLADLGDRLDIDVAAVEAEAERRSKLITLRKIKLRGYDTCQLCGAEIPVYQDDEWADILERSTEHAEERDDHILDPEQGWMLIDDGD